MVNLQEQMRLLGNRCATMLAGIMIPLFYCLTQLAGHQCPLACGTILKFDLFRQEQNKSIQIVNIHDNVVLGASITTGADIFEHIFWKV